MSKVKAGCLLVAEGSGQTIRQGLRAEAVEDEYEAEQMPDLWGFALCLLFVRVSMMAKKKHFYPSVKSAYLGEIRPARSQLI
jgi:hypothetical protein